MCKAFNENQESEIWVTSYDNGEDAYDEITKEDSLLGTVLPIVEYQFLLLEWHQSVGSILDLYRVEGLKNL